MTNVGKAEIRREVIVVTKSIELRTTALETLKLRLRAAQGRCSHPGVEVYRDRMTGTCEVCLKKFSSRGDIDMIYCE